MTQFQVLGPLAVNSGGAALRLGGVLQRATLACLLLRANRVTATSRLITALWPGEAPSSARKMVQNAVWRIRALPTGGAAALESHDPGYLLRVDPSEVDFLRFHELVDRGREQLRRDETDAAARSWRQALALWRGPMLADLVEAGFDWPEVTATEALRLDVLEDFYAAELRLGRHVAVLPELQSASLAEPHREGLAASLMLALYRSGRQAAALDVYARVRAELVESLGLEPGSALQDLHVAILGHEPALLGPDAGDRLVTTRAAEPGRPGDLVEERREVSVALLQAIPGDSRDDPEDIAATTAAFDTVVAGEAKRFGGVVTARLGQIRLVEFGTRGDRGNEGVRAVLTALAVRHRLRQHTAGQQVRCRAVVDSGAALVRYATGDPHPPVIAGAVLDRAQALLTEVPAGEVWAGAAIAGQTDGFFEFAAGTAPDRPSPVTGLRTGRRVHGLPLVRREQLAAVTSLLGDAECRVALVLGEQGMGKTVLLESIERRLAAGVVQAPPLVVRLWPWVVDDSVLRAAGRDLARCCGIDDCDPAELAGAKLATTVERVAPGAVTELVAGLRPLLTGEAGADLAAWRTFLRHLARTRPVTVVVDDLHTADDDLLDFVDEVLHAETADGLTVLAAARPELFRLRPGWRWPGNALSEVVLPPLAPEAVAEQVRRTAGSDPALVTAVIELAEGIPLFAAELSTSPGGEGAPMVPPAIARVLAARLDALPAPHRALLQDAAALGEVIRPEVMAVLHPRPEQVGEVLTDLEARGVLDAVDGGWVIRQPLLRHVAFARIPHGRLAAMHMLLASRAGRHDVPRGPHRPVVTELIRWHAARLKRSG